MPHPRNSILLLKMRMAKAAPRGRAPMRPSIKAVEGGYHADIRQYVADAKRLYLEQVAPLLPSLMADAARARQDTAGSSGLVRTDTYLDTLQSAITKAATTLAKIWPDDRLKAVAQRAAVKTDQFAGRVLNEQIKAVAAVDVTTSTPGIANRVADFTTDNVRMIKGLSSGYYDAIQGVVARNLQQGVRASAPGDRSKGFDEEIADAGNITDNRAALIARDQVNKFNGEVTRARQTDLGIIEYVWHNSDDERVRGNPGGLYPKARYSHWDREGQIYSWSDPPPDGHPGHPVNCRCWAEPVIPEF